MDSNYFKSGCHSNNQRSNVCKYNYVGDDQMIMTNTTPMTTITTIACTMYMYMYAMVTTARPVTMTMMTKAVLTTMMAN